jgi:flavin reductase (DIM6/NTAB) family NADH-FMN oxidoreductase RutF
VSSGEQLRALMRRVPSSVAVVTVAVDGQELGLTVSSLLALSLEPPLVGVSVSRSAALHELLRDAGSFGVSILAAGQEALAQHFARGVPPIALWTDIERRAGPGGAPLLEGALGWLECRVVAEHETGDHTLFVGEVTGVEQRRSARPLLHVGQEYRPL